VRLAAPAALVLPMTSRPAARETVTRVRRIEVMMPGDPAVDGITPPAGFDADSATWVRSLTRPTEQREAALARLHEMLLRIAHSELRRRSGQLRITGPELDDLAYQAAADALLAIMAKARRRGLTGLAHRALPGFRGRNADERPADQMPLLAEAVGGGAAAAVDLRKDGSDGSR